jgi:hypothetical protein
MVEAKTNKAQMANMRANIFLINVILILSFKVSNQWGLYYYLPNIH